MLDLVNTLLNAHEAAAVNFILVLRWPTDNPSIQMVSGSTFTATINIENISKWNICQYNDRPEDVVQITFTSYNRQRPILLL
jgi:hypothetical protein